MADSKASNTTTKPKNSKIVTIHANHEMKVEFKKTSSVLPYYTQDREITGRRGSFLESLSKSVILPKDIAAVKLGATHSAERRKPTTCCGKCCQWCWRCESRAKGDRLRYSPGRNCYTFVILLICALMLAFTLAVVIIASIPLELPVYGEDVFMEAEKFANTDLALYITGGCALAMIMVSFMFCCSYCSRVILINFLLLLITVGCVSYICAYVAIKVSANIVIGVVMTALIITLFCTLLACMRFDFTRFLFIVLVFFLTIIVVASMAAILYFVFFITLPVFSIIILVSASLISCLAIATMLQVMLKGNSVRVGDGEYAFGAFMLYNALISLFCASMKGMAHI